MISHRSSARELGLRAALEDFLLEQVARVDVHDDLRVADQAGLEDGELLLRVAGLLEDGLHDDGLAHDGGGLGQRHGRVLLQLGLAGGVGALVVEGVPQLVGDGADLVERAVEVAQHAAFLDRRHAHAERAAALAVALFGVDPVVVEGAFGEGRQVRREAVEVLQDEVPRFRLGVGFAAVPAGAKTSHQASFSLPSRLALALKYLRKIGKEASIAASMASSVGRSMRACRWGRAGHPCVRGGR